MKLAITTRASRTTSQSAGLTVNILDHAFTSPQVVHNTDSALRAVAVVGGGGNDQ